MLDSSYIREFMTDILASNVRHYYRLVLIDIAGKRSLYRSAEEMREGREMKPFQT